MRTMVDACDPRNLPAGHDLYASYVDGACAVSDNEQVRISSLATNYGNVGDCEPGNPTWVDWTSWVIKRRSAGVDPTIYCMDDGYGDDSVWAGWRHADGVAAFRAAGVPEPHWWVCHPGATEIPSYAVAVQTQLDLKPGFDLNIVADHWPGIDPAPSQENDMVIMTTPGQPAVLLTGSAAVPLSSLGSGPGVPPEWAVAPADYTAILKAQGPASSTGGGAVTFSPVKLEASGEITLTPDS